MIEPVEKITIITFKDYVEQLIVQLGKLGVVALKELEQSKYLGFKSESKEELGKYAALIEAMNKFLEKINLTGYKPDNAYLESPTMRPAIEIEHELNKYELEVNRILHEIEIREEKLKELEEIEPALRLLKKEGINPKELGVFMVSFSKLGYIHEENVYELKEHLKKYKGIIVEEKGQVGEEIIIRITGSKSLLEVVDKALALYGFRDISVKGVPGDIDEALKWLESEKEKLQTEIDKHKTELEEYINIVKREVYRLKRDLKYSYDITKAQAYALTSDTFIILEGWIPKKKRKDIERFLEDFKRNTNAKLVVSFSKPSEHEKPPSIFRNPKLFKAYESLTRQYGIPSPHETDPTIISAFLWTIMFGIMFPDWGQGLVIMAMGIWFMFRKKPLMGIRTKNIGKLMVGLGLSAVFFGLLAGDFFLTEIFPPLWPGLGIGWAEETENIVWLLKIALYVGVVEISLGLILNMYVKIKNKEYIEAILGEHGLMGLIGFCGLVLIMFHFIGLLISPGVNFGFFAIPRIELEELGMGVLTSLVTIVYINNAQIVLPIPPIGLFVGAIVGIAIRPIIEKEGVIMGAITVFESVLSFFANLLSYSRIAGFAISHIALSIVIAIMIEKNPFLGYTMGLIFLNVFSVTLEMLIVMIQAMRLLFYEFSTKFFVGEGTLFRPFKLQNHIT